MLPSSRATSVRRAGEQLGQIIGGLALPMLGRNARKWKRLRDMLDDMIVAQTGLEPKKITRTARRKWRKDFALPLAWAASTDDRIDTNLGDALSAIVVQAITGRRLRHIHFDEPRERLVAVGTIGQWQRCGKVHLWGTGVDPMRNVVGSPIAQYLRPPNTEFHVHAVRGPFSAAALRSAGIDAPAIFGDPVMLLPRIFAKQPSCMAELGVVVHISELENHSAAAAVCRELIRYNVPAELADSIRIINTYTSPSLASLRGKVAEITSCRRILSTSLHGLVIAEAYGIPCAWFAPFAAEHRSYDIGIGSSRIDPRVRDFYAGVGRNFCIAYCQDRNEETNWHGAMRFLDKSWRPLEWDGRKLFNAFPLPAAVGFSQLNWVLDEDAISLLRL
jgi:hypothetical protein